MVDSEHALLPTPPSSANPTQSLFLFVRPRDSSKSHYRPYSTLYSSITPPPTSRESHFSDRPISMMGFKKSSKHDSSAVSKSGGISLFGKSMKKNRSLTALRLLNNATEQPSPTLGSPVPTASPSDAYFSDSSNIPPGSSSSPSSSSTKTTSEEQFVAFPRVASAFDDEDEQDRPSVAKYKERDTWLHRRKMRLHPYGSEAPYMLSYDNVMLENDRWFYLLLRRLNPTGTPSFYEYAKNGTAPPTSALDLGCGLGHWILDAASHWKHSQIVGFDLVNVTLPEVHERENIKFVRGNFVRHPLPFPSNTFDLVRMANLSSCIPADRCEFVFSEVFRVLRVDGRLELIDDQLIFPYFATLKYQEEKPKSISDRDSEEVSRNVDPSIDAVAEEDMKRHKVPSFWEEDEDEDGEGEGEDRFDSESPSFPSHPYSAVYSEESSSSSSSSSVGSYDDKLPLSLRPLPPVQITFDPYAYPVEESRKSFEVKSTRRLSRPLPIPSPPSRPLPRPPSTISLDTSSDCLSLSSTTEDYIVTPTSAREARAMEVALRASLDEQVDGIVIAMALQVSIDEQNPSPLSIAIPSDTDHKLLPSPLPDSPTEPSFQPSPIVPDAVSSLETPTSAEPHNSSVLQSTSPSPLQPSSSIPPEWQSKASAAQNLETVYKGMLAEKGMHTQSIPSVMQRVFGAESTGDLATMHLMLAPEQMSDNVKTAKRSRAWTGSDKKWVTIEWDKKEKVRKEGTSTPISPILESRSSIDSSTSTPTPSKAIPEGISAKAAGRLGITYSELTAASTSVTPSRPSTSSSGSGSTGSSTLASSSGRNSCDSQEDTIVDAENPSETEWKLKQNAGLLLWPSTFIPMNPTELEMHACKGMHELLGSKNALAEYVASKKDEDGKPIVSEEEFSDAIWEYDCFRRERLNWPSNTPDLDIFSELPSYEENVEFPYTAGSTTSIAHAINPRNSRELPGGVSQFGNHTHVRTIMVYEAVKTRARRMNTKF